MPTASTARLRATQTARRAAATPSIRRARKTPMLTPAANRSDRVVHLEAAVGAAEVPHQVAGAALRRVAEEEAHRPVAVAAVLHRVVVELREVQLNRLPVGRRLTSNSNAIITAATVPQWVRR